MDHYADDLAAVIDALDLHDATIVGHSMGGGEVVHYIGRHGTARVSKVILVAGVPPPMLKTSSNPTTATCWRCLGVSPVSPIRDGSIFIADFVEYRKSGDRRLRDKIVEAHLALAYVIARRFEGRGEESEDLRQVALMALTGAVERFDPSRGYAFSTFATPTIAGALKRHLRDNTWIVRPPRSVGERALHFAATTENLTAKLGRVPTADELAATGGWTRAEVEEATNVLHTHRRHAGKSLDDSAAREIPTTRNDYSAADDRLLVDDLLAVLDERRRRIVRLRFAADLRQSSIAQEIGVSQMQISRLLAQSSELLRALSDPRERSQAG